MKICPKIRKERNADHDQIHELTELAFRDKPYAGGDEQDVVDRLRSSNALVLSLVAELNGTVVGHIAFSPALSGDKHDQWFALGPVSVLPEFQGRGIGTALIESGLMRIKNQKALGCILTGNPEYYRRFGFELSPQHVPPNEPEAFFVLKLFTASQPTGSFGFHPAFYGDT